MNLDEVADELYGLTPGRFTKTRDERAAEARRSGDKELASQIRALRRPTVSAWLANTLTRDRRDEVTRLTDLGAAMRRAQAELDGAALRELTRQRRALTGSLSDEAASLARQAGVETSDTSLRELTVTLESATSDEEASAALLTGHLVTALTFSGLESALASGLGAIPKKPIPRSPRPSASTKTAQATKGRPRAGSKGESVVRHISEAESLLKEARAATGATEREVARQQGLLERARTDRDRVAAQLNELERRLSSLKDQERRAERAEAHALKAIDDATLSLRSRRQAAKRAESVVMRLKQAKASKHLSGDQRGEGK